MASSSRSSVPDPSTSIRSKSVRAATTVLAAFLSRRFAGVTSVVEPSKLFSFELCIALLLFPSEFDLNCSVVLVRSLAEPVLPDLNPSESLTLSCRMLCDLDLSECLVRSERMLFDLILSESLTLSARMLFDLNLPEDSESLALSVPIDCWLCEPNLTGSL